MTTLFLLLLAIGLAPLAVGIARLRPGGRALPPLDLGSTLLCALAFNLTFFWQELWLVIPKALTPGLHPVLYHNDHGWTGHAPNVELLQGTGAVATLLSGLGFLAVLAAMPRRSPTWRHFAFWMAFQGLFQSLTQLAIGALLPGNDVGRALTYLHLEGAERWALLGLAVVAMAGAGALLARAQPHGAAPARAFAWEVLATVILATAITLPFRMPRNMIEVALVPLFINLVGLGWLVLGASLTSRIPASQAEGRPGVIGPALALIVTLLLFQLVLRPGIAV